MLDAAVALRSPVLAFPVADLVTGRCEGEGGGVLRHTLVLRPGSEVIDVFEALRRPPWTLVAGDFVRAECRLADGQVRSRLLPRTSSLPARACMTQHEDWFYKV